MKRLPYVVLALFFAALFCLFHLAFSGGTETRVGHVLLALGSTLFLVLVAWILGLQQRFRGLSGFSMSLVLLGISLAVLFTGLHFERKFDHVFLIILAAAVAVYFAARVKRRFPEVLRRHGPELSFPLPAPSVFDEPVLHRRIGAHSVVARDRAGDAVFELRGVWSRTIHIAPEPPFNRERTAVSTGDANFDASVYVDGDPLELLFDAPAREALVRDVLAHQLTVRSGLLRVRLSPKASLDEARNALAAMERVADLLSSQVAAHERLSMLLRADPVAGVRANALRLLMARFPAHLLSACGEALTDVDPTLRGEAARQIVAHKEAPEALVTGARETLLALERINGGLSLAATDGSGRLSAPGDTEGRVTLATPRRAGAAEGSKE